MTKTILFVCAGNTCRSPMAEQLFRKMLRDHKLEDQVQVRSAGISPGSSLSEYADTIIVEKCGTNDFIGPRGIEQERGERLDYVFVIGQSHITRVREVLGESGAEIMTLKAAASLSGDIRDPFSILTFTEKRQRRSKNAWSRSCKNSLSTLMWRI